MSDLFHPAANAILTDWPGPDRPIDWAIRTFPGPDVVIGFLVLFAEAALVFMVLVTLWKICRRLFGREGSKV